MKLKYIVPMFLFSAGVFAAPNDGQITKIVDTVNSGEVKMAEYAIKTTKNAEVKKFAEHMITDHTMNTKRTDALPIVQADSPKSMALKKDNESAMDKLKKLKGSEFDKAYVADQLKGHEAVLKELKTSLIPNAKNKDLKAHLEATAEKVQTHIEHAKALQATL